ncbi:hypothetical protein [Jeotgalibacillus salarius]|uniref:Uncharacterized protein n=1 Tax=Jeotgalibacillus salarius TaxID=546023 RepID=A0A4Y8LDC8_9BACL|nr:hypothetical protein [Jeotgalibacillus salarius]TFE00684.1 hypothetical protein E2626_11985 [Jeotgalibacillus salarius]
MKKFFNLNTFYIALAIIALSILFVPRIFDKIDFQTEGINYFIEHDENYHQNAHALEGEYTIEIDLSHLENNKGKVLFDDGENQIIVSEVTSSRTGEYEFFFRANGVSDLGGATIISGVEHTQHHDGLTSDFQAKAEAVHQGETYDLTPSAYTGLTESDQDEFGFHLALPNDIMTDLEENGTIDIVVTDLYINIWARKPV